MTLSKVTPSRRRFLATAGALTATPLLLRPAFADSAFPALSGKSVTMIIGSDIGGGYDLFGRNLARYLQDIIPGLRIAIQYIPKAGGKLAAKTLQEGPGDGSMFGVLPVSLMSAQILREEGVAYDIGTWSWIGKLATEARLYVAGPGADFNSIEELRERGTPATMAVRSTSSFAYYEALWINSILGIHIAPIPGYKSGDKEQAMVTGEVMLVSANYPDDRPILGMPDTRVVMRVNSATVSAPYDQAPTLRGLLGGDDRDAAVVEFLEANYELARWVVAPPAMEPAVLAEWRKAFDIAVASPAIIEDARKLDIELAPMSGVDLTGRITGILKGEDALHAKLSMARDCGKALAEGVGTCSHS